MVSSGWLLQPSEFQTLKTGRVMVNNPPVDDLDEDERECLETRSRDLCHVVTGTPHALRDLSVLLLLVLTAILCVFLFWIYAGRWSERPAFQSRVGKGLVNSIVHTG